MYIPRERERDTYYDMYMYMYILYIYCLFSQQKEHKRNSADVVAGINFHVRFLLLGRAFCSLLPKLPWLPKGSKYKKWPGPYLFTMFNDKFIGSKIPKLFQVCE